MKSKTQTQNSTKSNPKSKKRKKILIVTLSCALLIPMLSAAIAVATFAAWANTQHVDKSLLPTATALPVYYDISGNELPSEQSDFVEPNEVSDNLKNAFVALEDKRFYKHNGYDVVRMAGALVKNVKAGGIREGASTITQQLVKNTHLTQERTLSRKLKELAIAIQLEKEYDKDEILSMYLSVIYFGNGAYGVKQAANTYFGKSIDELDLSECATLAGIVRNPAKYSPISNAEQCKSRRNITLSVMREQGYIDEETYQNTISLPVLTVKDRPASHDSALRANSCEFYLSQVQNEVCEKLNMTKYQLSNSGLKIYTNLDSTLQAELEKQRLDINNYESDSVSSVSIILDNESGAVLAYSSSYPYNISRQAGSVLKPLAVYAPALDGNYISLATPIVDEKIDFGGFSPSNYGDKYYGDTTVREAIKKSMNSVSVKVLDYIGVDRSESYLRSFGIGIADSDKNYALALGATSKGVSPLSVAGGYSALARDGEYLKPSFVRYVVEDGNKVYTSDSHQNTEIYGSRAVSSATSALITSALVDTVNDGTAKSLSVLPFEVAAKTGTAQRSDGSNSDAWCASYNKQYTV
ncbi:MAG: transglycosylase domain-containing protein, partial [Clostridia bacterium]|nr:transglycosylase domain-containing protein [Clostridia bacterium]